jgi:molybdate transport system substrate-binding protein
MIVLAMVLLLAQDLSVAAASDLAGVSKQLTQAFASKGRVRFTLGSSGILAKQIEHGAPFDVFLSANDRYVSDLSRSGRIEGFSVRPYAIGQLGLWSLSGEIKSLEALADTKHVAMANPLHAPYGVAAKETLERQDLWHKLQPKIVYGENVRQALQYAESGNADAVLTAWPLLLQKPNAVKLPSNLHNPIRQVGGVVKGTKVHDLATRFLEFLTKGPGRQILLDGGFATP